VRPVFSRKVGSNSPGWMNGSKKYSGTAKIASGSIGPGIRSDGTKNSRSLPRWKAAQYSKKSSRGV
jgi:hypothetical protein